MVALRWKHGESSASVKKKVSDKLTAAGYADKVKWNGNRLSASVGFGVLLSLEGEITDSEIVLEKCAGAGGAQAQDAIEKILQEIFPGGKA